MTALNEASDNWTKQLMSWPYFLLAVFYLFAWHLLSVFASLFEVAPSISAWFPAAGLRFALIYILGWRLSIPILIIVWLSLAPGYWEFWMPSFPIGFVIESIGSPITHLIAVTLLVQVAKIDLVRGSLRDIMWFSVAALSAPMVSAIIACSNLAAASIFNWEDLSGFIMDFWVGDVIGILVVTPLAIFSGNAFLRRFTKRTSGQPSDNRNKNTSYSGLFLTMALVLFGVVLLVLGYGKLPVPGYMTHYVFLSFLPLSWIALRFGFLAITGAIFALNTLSIIIIHFTGFTADHAEFQYFLVALSLTGLFIYGLTSDQRSAENRANYMQYQLAHLDRVASINQIAGSLAHELKQPISAMSIYAQGCLEKLSTGPITQEELQEPIRAIARQSYRANELLKKIHSYIRNDEPKILNLDVAPIISDVIDILKPEASNANVIIQTNYGDIPQIYADEIEIQQVLVNLIRNAIEAVSACESQNKIIEISVHLKDQSNIEFTILSLNVAFSKSDAFHSFIPYQTSKKDGLGLGLSLCRAIVERHGGVIWSESQNNGDALFAFSLPAKHKEV